MKNVKNVKFVDISYVLSSSNAPKFVFGRGSARTPLGSLRRSPGSLVGWGGGQCLPPHTLRPSTPRYTPMGGREDSTTNQRSFHADNLVSIPAHRKIHGREEVPGESHRQLTSGSLNRPTIHRPIILHSVKAKIHYTSFHVASP